MKDEESQKEEIDRLIPPIKFSKSLLEKLCRIIEEVYSEITTQNGYNSLNLAYAYNNGISSTYHNTSSFLGNLKIKGLNHVSVYFYSGARQIRIEISVKGTYSHVTISGGDPTWVRGTSERMFEILDEYKLEVNSFIHSRKVWIIWIVFGISLSILLYYLIPKSTYQVILAFFIPANLVIWGHSFVGWLYPEVETEEITQVKFRKVFLSAIAIISALITIGSYLILLVRF